MSATKIDGSGPNSVRTHFIFDIDGTLTPSRSKIEKPMLDALHMLRHNALVHLATGSDFDKVHEQLGADLMFACDMIFTNSGNECWQNSTVIHENYYDWFKRNHREEEEDNYVGLLSRNSVDTVLVFYRHYANDFKLPDKMRQYLAARVADSHFPKQKMKPPHFEYRQGSVNFSIPGRGIDKETRKWYTYYDESERERERLVELFNSYYLIDDGIEARIGGQTGIDITPVGKDKRQILPFLRAKYKFPVNYMFFGDKIAKGGNDAPLLHALKMENDTRNTANRIFEVDRWEDTLEILQRDFKKLIIRD